MPKLLALVAILFVPVAHAAEVVVMGAGASRSAFTAAASAWERASGHAVKATFGSAGELRERLAHGEKADVLIVPQENLADYEKNGVVDAATRHDLGAVAIGAAVKEGAPRPDISTPAAFKHALEQAKSVTYMDPKRGTSGKFIDETVLPKLGIRDAVRAKTTLGEGGYIAEKVARGDVELAVHQMTELLPVKGITILGPLPAELQKVTVYTGVVMKGAAHPAEARALLDFLASPEGRKAFLDRGFSAPPAR